MGSKSPLQIQAYDYLKDMILNGKLEPDVLYSETRMAAEIGISRTPMREALQCLSQSGYITVVPSKGFMLRKLNEKDMLETIQIRCAIEGFCVRMAAAEIETKKGQKLLAELERLLERQEKVIRSKKGPSADNIRNDCCSKAGMNQFMEYDHKFHLALIHYAENEEFLHTFQRLMYLIRLTTVGALAVPGRTEETLKEHRLIFEHLRDGDGDGVYKLITMHLMTPLMLHLT
ncbi:MAG: GntR family transcriptional regulator [Otoolea sp.]|nr:GntR family transcriptional regulator [Clostridium sp.]